MSEPVNENGSNLRPYAPLGNVLDMIRRYRDLNLPEELEPDDFLTAGIPKGNVGRTAFSLRFLGLLSDASEPTDEWKMLVSLGDTEFTEQLGRIVRNAYVDVFKRFKPESDGQEQAVTAFRPYGPKSQIPRMVSLFLGLCSAGGISVRDAPKRRATNAQRAQQGIKRHQRQQIEHESSEMSHEETPEAQTPNRQPFGFSDLFRTPRPKADYSVIHAIVSKLPVYGEWTQGDHDKWLDALTRAVDFETTITEPKMPTSAVEATV